MLRLAWNAFDGLCGVALCGKAAAMALSEMLLALVDESGEAHGYGIHARLIEVFPGAAACERAEVYAVLRRLEKGGFLASFWTLGKNRRRRRQYRLREPGRRRLEGWLECPRPSRSLLRRTDLVRLAVLAAASPAPGIAPFEIRLRRKARQWSSQRRSMETLRGLSRLVAIRSLAHLEAEIEGLAALAGISSPAGSRCYSGW